MAFLPLLLQLLPLLLLLSLVLLSSWYSSIFLSSLSLDEVTTIAALSKEY